MGQRETWNSGYRVIGVTIPANPPLGTIHLQWEPTLFVLYGKNGAGKTSILRGFSNVLRHSSGYLHVQIDASSSNEVRSRRGLAANIARGVARSLEDDAFWEWPFVGDRRGQVHDLGKSLWWDWSVWSQEDPVDHDETIRAGLRRAFDAVPPEDGEIDGLIDELMSQRTFTLDKGAVWASALIGDETPQLQRLLQAAGQLRSRHSNIRWLFQDPRNEQSVPPPGRRLAAMPNFQTDDWPSWMPTPIRMIGVMRHGGSTPRLLQLADANPDQLTNEHLRASVPPEWMTEKARASKLPWNIAISADKRQVSASTTQVFGDHIGRIEERANRYFQNLLLEAPTLRLQLLEPKDWFEGKLASWHALDRATDTWLPIAAMSKAQQRWASIAIQQAITLTAPTSLPTAMVIDEPEEALHPQAIEHLTHSLLASAVRQHGPVIVATHSPQILACRTAKLFHVIRQPDRLGAAGVELLLDETKTDLALFAEQLGVHLSDLIHLYRTFLVVEGRHDSTVLQATFPNEWERARTRFLHMSGTDNLSDLAGSDWILNYTDASIVVLLDAVPGGGVPALWEEQRDDLLDGLDPQEALKRIAQYKRLNRKDLTHAERKALEFCENGVRNPDRFEVVGFQEPDILDYFDVRDFVPQAESWEALRTEHREYRKAADGKPLDFKGWLREHPDLIRPPDTDQLEQLARDKLSLQPPDDFVKLLEACRRYTD